MIMFAGRATRNALLVLFGILPLIMAMANPAWAKGGIWWYGNNKWFNVTLINLTEHSLKTTYKNVSSSMNCFPYPFEHYGVNVEPYGSAIWLNEVTDLVWLMHYSGKMTFLPEGMDPKWSFDLNFTPQNGSGATLGEGTWVYLTASDPVNTGWVPSWDSAQIPDEFYLGHLGYATRMSDGKPRNLMNLQAEDIGLAVSVYSPNNTNIVVVVQAVDTETYYEAWKLEWADNQQNSLPH
jgi:hypothetical protein